MNFVKIKGFVSLPVFPYGYWEDIEVNIDNIVCIYDGVLGQIEVKVLVLSNDQQIPITIEEYNKFFLS